MISKQKIYCVPCNRNVMANLVNGSRIYPSRKDLYVLQFWRCPTCRNFVGCHKGNSKNKPLGCIAGPELKGARIAIHNVLDPLWQIGNILRADVYRKMTQKLASGNGDSWTYHTADINNIAFAKRAYAAAIEIKTEVMNMGESA